MKSRANFFHGVTAKNDPRFKGKMVREVIDYPPNVTESIETEKINAMSFEEWIQKEISKYTDDELIPGIVQGYLEGKEIDSQDLGRTLKPFIGLEHTKEFVSRLWDLLLDAQSNELGIPSAFLEQSKQEIEEKNKQFARVRELIQESSSSSSSSSDTEKELENHDFGFPAKIMQEEIQNSSLNQSHDHQRIETSNESSVRNSNRFDIKTKNPSYKASYNSNSKSLSNGNSNSDKWSSNWSKDGFLRFKKDGVDIEEKKDDSHKGSTQIKSDSNQSNYGYNYSYGSSKNKLKNRKRKDYSSYSSYSSYSGSSGSDSYSTYSYSYGSTSESSDNDQKVSQASLDKKKSKSDKKDKDVRKDSRKRKNKKHDRSYSSYSYSYSSSSSTPSSPPEPPKSTSSNDAVPEKDNKPQTEQESEPKVTIIKTHSYSSSEYEEEKIPKRKNRRHHRNPIGYRRHSRH